VQEQACESFTWFGDVLTESGQYSQTIANAAGCDSTITLNLTILESTSSTLQEQACESFTWFGDVLTESGQYSQTIVNAAGCDSTITLNLTILQPSSSIVQEQACESFTWFGDVLTESGQYSQTIANAVGCDSTITLQLLIIDTPDFEITVEDDILISNQMGDVFQWLDCTNNFTAIEGANQNSFSPLQSGEYTLQIEINGCLSTAACVSFIVDNTDELAKSDFTVYPNPSETGLFSISADKPIAQIKVLDTSGRSVPIDVIKLQKTEARITQQLSPGYYILRVLLEDGTQLSKTINVIR
jgi:hypothetical protein